jgi:hypothetical protein
LRTCCSEGGGKTPKEKLKGRLNVEERCTHEGYGTYTSRTFDVLNGFEMIAIRCLNCYKPVELTVRGLNEDGKLEARRDA